MQTARPMIVGTFVFAVTFTCCLNSYAQNQQQQTSQTQQPADETTQKPAKPSSRKNIVKIVDFYLKDGKVVFGKLLSDNRNKITIEQLDGPKIIVSTYSKMQVDSRTINTKKIPEYKYYLDLAEYFSARTWDFRDDPDDFIQAIRSYEKAKLLIAEAKGPQDEKIEQINKKIQNLEADRQHWTEQTRSRAELKKMEFIAEFEPRLKELDDKISANNQQFGTVLSVVKDNHQQLQNTINTMNNDISHELDMLSERVDYNRRIINYILYRWRRFPPHGWTLPKDLDSERQ